MFRLSPLAKARKTTLTSRAPTFRLGTGVGSTGTSPGFTNVVDVSRRKDCTAMNQLVF